MSPERCCMIIDAEPVVRAGVRHELEADWGFEELPHGGDAGDVLRSVAIEVAIIEMRAAADGAPSGTATIRELLVQQPGLAVVGHGGTVLRSTDHGQTFTLINRPDRLSLAGVTALDNGNLILVGQGGVHLAASTGADLGQQ